MHRIKTDDSFNLNLIENKKTFGVSAVASAYNFTTKPSFIPHPENYNFSQILLVLEGEGTYTTETAQYAISPGKMFYRPAYKSSIYEWHTDRVRLALISFVCDSEAMKTFEREPITLYEEEAILLDVIKTGTRICEPMKENEAFRGMRFKDGVPEVVLGYISSSLERFLSMLYCRLCGIELLTDESQKANMYRDSSKLVHEIKAYMSEHISSQLTLADICTAFGISQTALTKKFRRETDSGVIEYYNELKIREAKRLIRDSSLSFTEISEKMGFASASYFTKVFKKHTGATPTEYSKYVSKRRIVE